jgi:hypothetical protein
MDLEDSSMGFDEIEDMSSNNGDSIEASNLTSS